MQSDHTVQVYKATCLYIVGAVFNMFTITAKKEEVVTSFVVSSKLSSGFSRKPSVTMDTVCKTRKIINLYM